MTQVFEYQIVGGPSIWELLQSLAGDSSPKLSVMFTYAAGSPDNKIRLLGVILALAHDLHEHDRYRFTICDTERTGYLKPETAEGEYSVGKRTGIIRFYTE